MKKRHIDWNKLDYLVGRSCQTEHCYIGDGLLIMTDSSERPGDGIVVGCPYHSNWGCVVRMVRGWMKLVIHMESYTVGEGMVLVVPENCIIEMEACSEDNRFQAVNFHDMPASLGFNHVCLLKVGEEDSRRTDHYMELMLQVVRQGDYERKTIEALTLALLTDINHIRNMHMAANPMHSASHHETIFAQFVSLVDKHGATERNIQFYADHIHLTPNHLGTIIRQQSGQTAAWWFNRATIQQAKVLLRYSDFTNSQIADRMKFSSPSAFSGFFKRETDLSPSEYREMG